MHEGVENYKEHLLELTHRNILQAHIIMLMLGDGRKDREVLSEWARVYGTRISDFIDNPEEENLRARARAGEYKEVAEEIIARMREQDEAQTT